MDHAVLVHVLTKKEKGIFRQRKIRQNFMGQVRSILRPEMRKNQKGRILIRKYFLKCCLILQKRRAYRCDYGCDGGRNRSYSVCKAFPKSFFDVGIAEEHAMTFAAGLAAGGMKPIFAVYSSFCKERMTRRFMMSVCKIFRL